MGAIHATAARLRVNGQHDLQLAENSPLKFMFQGYGLALQLGIVTVPGLTHHRIATSRLYISSTKAITWPSARDLCHLPDTCAICCGRLRLSCSAWGQAGPTGKLHFFLLQKALRQAQSSNTSRLQQSDFNISCCPGTDVKGNNQSIRNRRA